ncbi:DoxX family protein [Chitinophaga skermanii]|nr:DoxX family protein [Chitinophaga skermanii]
MKKLFSAGYTNGGVSFALLLLRVTFGVLLITHGWMKLQGFSEMSGQFPDPIGLGSKVALSLTIFAEVFCAGFVALGLFTRLATIPVIICMLVIVFHIHGADVLAKKESGIMYLVVFLSLLITGPGKYSVDGLIGKK